MNNLSTTISSLVNKEYKLVIYSELTQSLVNSKDVILWTSKPADVDISIYTKFKDAIKHRGVKFYTLSQTLPYQDFCISLLCAHNYSLNHISVPSINSRAYVAAWRCIDTISITGDPDVKAWLSNHLVGRTAVGYSTSHGVHLDNAPISTSISSVENVSYTLSKDETIIRNAVATKTVIPIRYYEDGSKGLCIFKSTLAPESQLLDLQVVHREMNLQNTRK